MMSHAVIAVWLYHVLITRKFDITFCVTNLQLYLQVSVKTKDEIHIHKCYVSCN